MGCVAGCASVEFSASDAHGDVFEYCVSAEEALAAYEDKVVGSLFMTDGFKTERADPGETIFIFDWDDTLYPLTWFGQVRSTSGEPLTLAEVRTRHAPELKVLSNRVRSLLTTAQQLGKVVIMTSACRPLVELRCAKLMPQVSSMLRKIPMVCAMDHVTEAEKSARPINELLREAKTRAMKYIAADVCPRSHYKAWTNMIFIGDSQYNFDAIREVVRIKPYTRPCEKTCYTKTVRMCENPSPSTLVLQHTIVARWLSHVVHAGIDVDIELPAGAEAVLQDM